jgi:hypothetical protein
MEGTIKAKRFLSVLEDILVSNGLKKEIAAKAFVQLHNQAQAAAHLMRVYWGEVYHMFGSDDAAKVLPALKNLEDISPLDRLQSEWIQFHDGLMKLIFKK